MTIFSDINRIITSGEETQPTHLENLRDEVMLDAVAGDKAIQFYESSHYALHDYALIVPIGITNTPQILGFSFLQKGFAPATVVLSHLDDDLSLSKSSITQLWDSHLQPLITRLLETQSTPQLVIPTMGGVKLLNLAAHTALGRRYTHEAAWLASATTLAFQFPTHHLLVLADALAESYVLPPQILPGETTKGYSLSYLISYLSPNKTIDVLPRALEAGLLEEAWSYFNPKTNTFSPAYTPIIKKHLLKMVEYSQIGMEVLSSLPPDTRQEEVCKMESLAINTEVLRLRAQHFQNDDLSYRNALSLSSRTALSEAIATHLIWEEPMQLKAALLGGEAVAGRVQDKFLYSEHSTSIREGDVLVDKESLVKVTVKEIFPNGLKLSGDISDSPYITLLPTPPTFSDFNFLRKDPQKRSLNEVGSLNIPTTTDDSSSLISEIFSALKDGSNVIVNSPPGGGKTTLLVDLIEKLFGNRIVIATYTVAQSEEICKRLSKRGIPAAWLLRSGAVKEEIPLITQADSPAKALDEFIIVSTVAKLEMVNFTADLLIIDEAYQVTAGSAHIISGIAPQHIYIGDPGQLDPVISISTLEWDLSPHFRPHLPSPLQSEEKVVTVQIPFTYRLPQSTVDVIAPLFYPNLSFSSGQRGLQVIQNSNPLWERLVEESIITDATIQTVEELADTISALLTTNPSYGDKDEIKVLTPKEVGVITPHRSSVSSIQKALRNLGLGEIEVETVERWQGKEKKVMFGFISPEESLEFSMNKKRLCVMLSRHQLGVILMGAVETLRADFSAVE